MRTSLLLLLTTLAITTNIQAGAVGEGCLQLEPNTVILTGTLVEHKGLRSWLGLKSDEPVCTMPAKDTVYGAYDIPGHTGIGEVHLIFLGEESSISLQRIEPGTRVSATGQLIPRTTAYHETPILLRVKILQPAGPKAPPKPTGANRLTINSNVLRPDQYFVSVTVRPAEGQVAAQVTETPSSQRPLMPATAFVAFFFNGPKDIMWVDCPSGYRPGDVSSRTRSKVFMMSERDPKIPTWGVSIDQTKPTNINFVCAR
ncbi:MAG TPA: hypothetical protein PLZ95_06565 [Bryobacteraceae bacterium]|nr:hypothetical protein [Bryobacteraceae bacterium]